MTPTTPKSLRGHFPYTDDDIPTVGLDESFTATVTKLTHYITRAVDTAYSYEQLRTTVAGQHLQPLVLKLSENCHYPAIVAALL